MGVEGAGPAALLREVGYRCTESVPACKDVLAPHFRDASPSNPATLASLARVLGTVAATHSGLGSMGGAEGVPGRTTWNTQVLAQALQQCVS